MHFPGNCDSCAETSGGMGVGGFLLATAPSVCFFLLQLSSIDTMKQILRNKSTGSLSPMPFVSLLTNCVVWSLFGVLRSDPAVLFPNFSGVLTLSYMFSQFSVMSSAVYRLQASFSAARTHTSFTSTRRRTCPGCLQRPQ